MDFGNLRNLKQNKILFFLLFFSEKAMYLQDNRIKNRKKSILN